MRRRQHIEVTKWCIARSWSRSSLLVVQNSPTTLPLTTRLAGSSVANDTNTVCIKYRARDIRAGFSHDIYVRYGIFV